MSLSEDTVAQSSTAPLAPVRHSSPLGPISEWISVERLVDGSERVGGMLVRSVQFKRLFASITRFAPLPTSSYAVAPPAVNTTRPAPKAVVGL